MTVGVGGQGFMGLAFETTIGTWAAPTKFIPILSETLQKVENKQYRMGIRGVVDRWGAIQGYTHIEGDTNMEVTTDAILYPLYCSRMAITKSAGPPYTYTFVGAHLAAPSTAASGTTTRRTASIFVNRGASVGLFGYLGMSVVRQAYSIDGGSGDLVCNFSWLGIDEAQQSLPTASFAPNPDLGPGDHVVSIAAGTRTDIDTFSVDINDNGTAEPRLRAQKKVSFIRWGDREVSGSFDHDFENLTDYNAFLAQTAQAIQLQSTNNATNDRFTIAVNTTDYDAYPVNLPNMGDLVRANVSYHGIYGGSPVDAATITVITAESIS